MLAGFLIWQQGKPKVEAQELAGKNYIHSYDEIMNELRKAGFKLVRKEVFNWLLFSRASENFLGASFCQDGKAVRTEEDAERESVGDDARRKARVKAAFLSSWKTFLVKYI